MNRPRCSGHTNEARLPECRRCKRIAIEQRIVKRTVKTLLRAGYRLNVYNGGDGFELPAYSSDQAEVLGAMMASDEDRLYVKHAAEDGPKLRGYVYFVYGNDGWDVINDYTTNLETLLTPVNEMIDKGWRVHAS